MTATLPTPSSAATAGSTGSGAPLRIGLIGAGKMGLNHLKAIGACTGVEIVGVADPQADVEALRPLLPASAVIVGSLDELVAQGRPDVVHIVTPPHTHAPIARAALSAGLHVYVEKPFTLARPEAEALTAFAAEKGRLICAGHQCLFEHAAIDGRAALARLGTIVHVESYFSFKTVRRSITPIDQAKDILPHAVYMLIDYLRAGSPGLEATPVTLLGADASADGDVYGVLSLGACRGLLTVTLRGRPVEQYLHVVGTNGSMRVDLVSDAVTALEGPGASAVGALMSPYRLAWQSVTRSTSGFSRRIRGRKFGYPGHKELCQAFYDSIRGAGPAAMTASSILETVGVCESIGRVLDEAEAGAEAAAEAGLAARAAALPPVSAGRGIAVVTGAAGFLGRGVVRELRAAGWSVRALTRQPLRLGAREPGVDYRACDLSRPIPADVMAGATFVAHCAAETKGGAADQERNSIKATRHIVEAAADAGAKRLVHVSSVAVMRPPASASREMDEATPVDLDNRTRGPYVWGKAESERVVTTVARERGVDVRIIRLGPLVDYAAFEAPGRLGRELGPLYVAVGPKRSPIALLDVGTAAEVIRSYGDHFESAAPVLNLVEPEAPARRELLARLRARRPELRVFWLPMWFLRVISPPLKLVQRVMGSKAPLDIASAFTSPRYRTELSAQAIAKARTRAPARVTSAP
jgi:predicted dehydrogenase/nucleoside-diphosphate-sugar epimerase